MPPAKRNGGIPKKGASSRQREIHQGTKPATNPGAITRKTAEPIIASSLLTTSSMYAGPSVMLVCRHRQSSSRFGERENQQGVAGIWAANLPRQFRCNH